MMLTQSSTAEVFYDKIRKELRVTSIHQCSNLRSLGRIIGAVTVAFLEKAAKYDDGDDENEVQSSDHVSVNLLDKSKVWSGIPTSLSLFPMPVFSEDEFKSGRAKDVTKSSVSERPASLKIESLSRCVDYEDVPGEVGTSETSFDTRKREGGNAIPDIQIASDVSFSDKDIKSGSKEKESQDCPSSDWSDEPVESTRMEDETYETGFEPLSINFNNCSPDSSIAKNGGVRCEHVKKSVGPKTSQILTVPKYAAGKTRYRDEARSGISLHDKEKLPLNLSKNKCVVSDMGEVEVKKEIVDDWFKADSDNEEAASKSNTAFSLSTFHRHSVRHKSGFDNGFNQSFDDVHSHSVHKSHLPVLHPYPSQSYGEVTFPPSPQNYSKIRSGMTLSYMSSEQHYLKPHGSLPKFSGARYPRPTSCHGSSNRLRRGHLKCATCAICGVDIKDRNDFSNHVSLHCLEDRQNCPICLKPFSNRANLLRHSSLHILGRLYQCPVCYRRIKRGDNFLVHMRNQHPEEHAGLSAPSASPGTASKFNIKSIKKEADDMFIPLRTSESDASSKAGKTPMLSSNSEANELSTEKYGCPLCFSNFGSSVLLQEHITLVHDAYEIFDGKI